MSVNRRQFLSSTALALGSTVVAGVGVPSLARAADTIKMGSILDTSGAFDAYGKPMQMAADLAVQQINADGGLLGKSIEMVSYDTQSDMSLYTQYGQQLSRRDKVDVVHGGILSASREAMRPTLRKNKTLYFYNVLYEGGVCDRNVVCTGVTPAQQIEVLVPEAVSRFGKKVYILAADYNYGQITAKWFQHYLKENGAEAVEVEFFPLDVSDFGATITKIQQAKPDFVLGALVGGAHMSFYRQWAATGMNKRIPMATTTLGVGNGHVALQAEEGDGILCAYNYSKQTENPANDSFLKAWSAKYGDTSAIHEIAVSNYQGIMLWAEAVRQAGSLEREKMLEVIESGLSIEGPSGKVSIDAGTHHAALDVHLMEIRDQKLNVLKSFSQRQPVDTQGVCDLKANPRDTTQYEISI